MSYEVIKPEKLHFATCPFVLLDGLLSLHNPVARAARATGLCRLNNLTGNARPRFLKFRFARGAEHVRRAQSDNGKLL